MIFITFHTKRNNFMYHSSHPDSRSFPSIQRSFSSCWSLLMHGPQKHRMEQRKFIRHSYGYANGNSQNPSIHTVQLCNNKFYLLLLIFFRFLIKLCTFDILLPTSYIPIPSHNIVVHNLEKRIKKNVNSTCILRSHWLNLTNNPTIQLHFYFCIDLFTVKMCTLQIAISLV